MLNVPKFSILVNRLSVLLLISAKRSAAKLTKIHNTLKKNATPELTET